MLENLIRVGPPQGSLKDVKNHHEDHDPKAREDFDKEYQNANKRMEDKEQVQKKLSGGTKKKTIKAEKKSAEEPEEHKVIIDPSMISKGLVSKEDEIEIADSDKSLLEVENLDNKVQKNNSLNEMQALPELKGTPLVEKGINDESSSDKIAANSNEFKHLNATELAMMNDINQSESQDAISSEDMSLVEASLNLDQPMSEVDSKLQLPQQGVEQKLDVAVDKSIDQTLKQPATEVATATLSQVDVHAVNESSSNQVTPDSKLDLQKKIETMLKQDSANSDYSSNMGAKISFADEKFKSSAENGSDQKSQSNSQSDQGLLRSEPRSHEDLSAQVSALQLEQKSFNQHLNNQSMHVGASDQSQKINSASDSHNDENIKSIMNQAKFLVTKGGGEMVVRMTPEGMGEVHLKVMLDQGKVNIELNSQDKSVKKLIEDNLSDLKSSLALHQMRVDHVKINNVTAVETNNQAGLQSNLNHSNPEQQSTHLQNQNGQPNMSFSQNQSGSSHFDRQQNESRNFVNDEIIAKNISPRVQTAKYTASTNKGRSINMVA